MRKILFIVFGCAAIFLGCSKNDNNNSPATIVGTWTVNNFVVSTYFNDSLTYTQTSGSGSVQFANDGTFSSIDSLGGLHSGTYTFNASTNVLVRITGGDTITANVTNLTSNNLHLNSKDSNIVAGNIIRAVVDEDYKR